LASRVLTRAVARSVYSGAALGGRSRKEAFEGAASDAIVEGAQEVEAELQRFAARRRQQAQAASASRDRGEVQRTRARAVEACRRLLYHCVFSASISAHYIAQTLLMQSYRRAGRRRLEEDEVLLPLVQRLCSPVEWARCAQCCRGLRARGWSSRAGCPAARQRACLWLQGFSAPGHKEAMRLAVHYNIVGFLQPLAEAGADMNCVFESCWFRTPLHRAASRGQTEMCRLLTDLRADPALRDSHGAAPIHLVASKGRVAIVNLLLWHHPQSTRAVDFSGRTPLHMAALKGHLGVVRRLLAARADTAATASDHRTPLHMAHRGQHAHLIAFMESWQRRRDEALPAARQILGLLFQRSALREEAAAAARGSESESQQQPPRPDDEEATPQAAEVADQEREEERLWWQS